MNPPPVMCAMPLTLTSSSKDSTGFTYSLVGVKRTSPSTSPPSSGNLSFRLYPDCSRSNLRTSEKPLLCTPLEARPITVSPAVIEVPLMILLLSTTPTVNPAISYSPSAYIPGISAVSPPINAQPDSLQPSAIPDTIASIFSGMTLSQAR
ncbi:hypothetical protein D3C78_1505260 [compost metagenome]